MISLLERTESVLSVWRIISTSIYCRLILLKVYKMEDVSPPISNQQHPSPQLVPDLFFGPHPLI